MKIKKNKISCKIIKRLYLISIIFLIFNIIPWVISTDNSAKHFKKISRTRYIQSIENNNQETSQCRINKESLIIVW